MRTKQMIAGFLVALALVSTSIAQGDRLPPIKSKTYKLKNGMTVILHEDKSTPILIGDQSDPAFLAELRRRFPRVDILIDDGGHFMKQQITTFRELYRHVQPEGVYLCEDVHTSYMSRWDGGLRRAGTFIEFSKTLVDDLHAWYHLPQGTEMDEFSLGTYSISFYDSIVVIEKRPIHPPRSSQTGKASF